MMVAWCFLNDHFYGNVLKVATWKIFKILSRGSDCNLKYVLGFYYKTF